MLDRKNTKALLGSIVILFASAGCGTEDDVTTPDEIPTTPAELVFDGVEGTVDESAAWIAPTGRLIASAGPAVSCADRIGTVGEGDVRLSVAVPGDAEAGSVYELPSDAPMGEGPDVSVTLKDNVSFAFGRGLIVVDARTDTEVTIRLDVWSDDHTKSARGAVTAPICP